MSSPEPEFRLRPLLILWLLLLAGGAVQTSLPTAPWLFHSAPDLVLCTAVAASLLYGPAWGALFGFFGAYLWTARVPLSPGSFYTSHIVASYVPGLIRSRLYPDHPLVPAIAGALAGALSQTIFYLLTPRSPELWLQNVAAQAAWAAMITPCICLVAWFRMPEREEE